MKNIRLISCGAALGILAACSTVLPALADPNDGNAQPTTSANSATTQGTTDQSGNPSMATASSATLSFQDLPQAVQNTVRGQIGDQQIREVKQETKDGQTAFKIELVQRAGWLFHPTLIVAANGAILKESHMAKVNEAAGANTTPQQ